MRSIQICILGLVVGCSAENAAPPPITPDQRQTMKQNLTGLGAKVTAEVPDGLYLSLRNTHVEVRDFGGVIEGAYRTRRDVQDFGMTNEAIAKVFLDSAELENFKQWLRGALSPRSPSPQRADYSRYKVTLSRAPLRVAFSQKQPTEAE